MEDAQPQYGPLLQSTVDKVGYPAIDEDGEIRTIGDGLDFWAAVGWIRGYAGRITETRHDEIMGVAYLALEAVRDEEGMVLARRKGEFFDSFSRWIESNEPEALPMKSTPDWLQPFLDDPELKA